MQKQSLMHSPTSDMAPHICWFPYVSRKGRFMNREPVWRSESTSRRLGDLQWILQAAISFGQIIHTSYAEIVYANHRQLPKQELTGVHLPLNHVDSFDIQQGYPGVNAIFSAINASQTGIPSLFHILN